VGVEVAGGAGKGANVTFFEQFHVNREKIIRTVRKASFVKTFSLIKLNSFRWKCSQLFLNDTTL
jgi:hypothetical protein